MIVVLLKPFEMIIKMIIVHPNMIKRRNSLLFFQNVVIFQDQKIGATGSAARSTAVDRQNTARIKRKKMGINDVMTRQNPKIGCTLSQIGQVEKRTAFYSNGKNRQDLFLVIFA